MEIIIAMLIGIAAAILGVIVALVIIFCRIKENNELSKTIYFGVRDIYAHLLEVQNGLPEKEPKMEAKMEGIEELGSSFFKAVKDQADKRTASEKFEVGTKVIAMKGIHMGEIYTIEEIDFRWHEAILKPYKLLEGGNYMVTLHVHLDGLENEFEPLEDE